MSVLQTTATGDSVFNKRMASTQVHPQSPVSGHKRQFGDTEDGIRQLLTSAFGLCLSLFALAGIFFFGFFLLSARYFFAGVPFEFHRAVISVLTSPSFNPRGYLAGDAAMAVTGLALLPGATWFFLRLRTSRPRLARAGSTLFVCGALGIVVIGLTSPFELHTDSLHHVLLAYFSFFSFAIGIFVLLLVLAMEERHAIVAAVMKAAALLQAVSIGSLLFLFWRQLAEGRPFFDDRYLLRSMAFCQWALCAENALCFSALAYGVAAVYWRSQTARCTEPTV